MSHSRHSIQPTSHFLRMSHSRHSIQPTSRSLRMSHSRNSIRPTSQFLQISHSRHSIRPTSHLLRMSHSRNSIRLTPLFSGCLTAAILFDWCSTFSGYLTFGVYRRMGEESICGQRFTLHPDSLARWSIWQLNTLAVNWSLLSRISRLHFLATLLYTLSPLFASLIGNLLF